MDIKWRVSGDKTIEGIISVADEATETEIEEAVRDQVSLLLSWEVCK